MYKVLNLKALLSRHLRTRVQWQPSPQYKFPYMAIVNGHRWTIQTHEFPFDDKYSLHIDGTMALEFSSWPEEYWGKEPDVEWQQMMDELEKNATKKKENA